MVRLYADNWNFRPVAAKLAVGLRAEGGWEAQAVAGRMEEVGPANNMDRLTKGIVAVEESIGVSFQCVDSDPKMADERLHIGLDAGNHCGSPSLLLVAMLALVHIEIAVETLQFRHDDM